MEINILTNIYNHEGMFEDMAKSRPPSYESEMMVMMMMVVVNVGKNQLRKWNLRFGNCLFLSTSETFPANRNELVVVENQVGFVVWLTWTIDGCVWWWVKLKIDWMCECGTCDVHFLQTIAHKFSARGIRFLWQFNFFSLLIYLWITFETL